MKRCSLVFVILITSFSYTIAQNSRETEQVFEKIYNECLWGKNDSGEGTSGPGSTLEHGWNFVQIVQNFLNTHNIESVIDVGCGDWVLDREIDWGNRKYLGVDVVKSVVQKNRERYSSATISFLHANAIEDPLPKADLIICRDVLVHLSFKDIVRAIKQFKASGSTYLITTSFPARTENRDVITGDWWPLNLMAPPFNFPIPEFLINEHCTEGGGVYNDKSCGLWKLSDIPDLEFLDIQNHNIVSKYHLNIGNYLISANKKVQITDWLNPTIDDYRILQHYLKSPRPELCYTNYPGTTFREERLRDFNIIDESKNEFPKFDILYLNNAPSDKKRCIVTYVSCNDRYIKKLNALVEQLQRVGFDGHLIFRIGGWPNIKGGSLEFFDVPYAFKIFSMLEAKELGYENCLWLDSSFLPQKELDPVFRHINEHGVFFHANPAYSSERHIQEFAAEALGVSLSEFLRFTAISSFAVGLDLNSANGMNVLNAWSDAMKQRLGFLSFIPEMAPLYVIIDRLKLLQYAANPDWFASSPNQITSEVLLYWKND